MEKQSPSAPQSDVLRDPTGERADDQKIIRDLWLWLEGSHCRSMPELLQKSGDQ
jgi:hypothetical protein